MDLQKIVLSVRPLPCSGTSTATELKVFAKQPIIEGFWKYSFVLTHCLLKGETGDMLETGLSTCV